MPVLAKQRSEPMKNALAIARKVAAYVGAAVVAQPRRAAWVALCLGFVIGHFVR